MKKIILTAVMAMLTLKTHGMDDNKYGCTCVISGELNGWPIVTPYKDWLKNEKYPTYITKNSDRDMDRAMLDAEEKNVTLYPEEDLENNISDEVNEEIEEDFTFPYSEMHERLEKIKISLKRSEEENNIGKIIRNFNKSINFDDFIIKKN